MSRINTNVPALVSQRALRQNQQSLQLSLERLSTGLRINRGADDPAGLMNSEKLRADISSTNKAISNSQRASNFIATSEGALNEISSLLIDMQGLIIQAANDAAMSDEEKKANQLQIDSAIDAITRIANSTTYAGRNPLNGSLSYSTSGVQISELPNVNITGAQFGTLPKINVNVQVTSAAQKGQLLWQHD
ncbi:MAG: flagellin, partial [Phycisphaerae bacterium]|nr:flagellin [Phycisphaerae bacterium]